MIKPHPLALKILLTLLPILLLFWATEGLLRLLNYGGQRAVIIERTIGGRRVYALNENVARRYFTQKYIRPAVHKEQTFEKEKPDKTYRIFCLGGSTTYGFPYPPNINFPVFLKHRLQALFPDHKFEVINAGVPATSSFAVVDLVRELVKYQPDLFLIAMGHEEFYGALGPASTEGFGRHRALNRLHLDLQKYQSYLLIRDVVLSVHDHDSNGKDDQNLMQRLAGKENITLASEEHQIAIQNFIDNLLACIDMAQRHGVKIMVSDLVSNLKDQQPFETLLMPAQDTWTRYLKQGDEYSMKGDSAKAAFLYQRAATIFPESADAHFILGRRYLTIGNRAKAREHFETALDFDRMPFRPRTEFHRALVAICADRGVPVVPIHEVFALNSGHGIPGNEVFSDHVHPNQLGYFLMAKQFCISMYEHDCMAPKSSWDLSRNLSDEAYWKMAAITPLDVAIGKMRAEILKKSWPFQLTPLPDSLRMPKLATPIDSITFQHVAGKIDWPAAHVEVAKILIRAGQHTEAQKEYLAIRNIAPDSLDAHLGMAETNFPR
jgi:tetratricopeptide (TPR) repeat protein